MSDLVNYPEISRRESWLYWRARMRANPNQFAGMVIGQTSAAAFWENVNHRHSSMCPICQNSKSGLQQLRAADTTKTIVYCLCESYRWQAEVQRDIQELGFVPDAGKTVANFNPKFDDTSTAKENIEYVAEWIKRPHASVFMRGRWGSGKSHLANAMMNSIFPIGALVNVNSLTDKLHTAIDDGTITAFEQRVRNLPYIVLDDFGAHYDTPYIASALYRIVNHRYENKTALVTVTTTNMPVDPAALAATPANVVRIIDRLMATNEGTQYWKFTQKSFRSAK